MVFATFCTGCCAPKPDCCTVPWLPWPPVATPEPKSQLATVPLTPLAPPDPLPCPGPTGMSNDPICAATNLAPALPSPLSPLGSPKPPVCTFSIGLLTVGCAALPAKDPV